MPRYSLGLDFGTESVRALLVDLDDGREVATAQYAYPNGVISGVLPTDEGVELGRDWFLQDPADYVAGLERAVRAVLAQAGASGADVVGIGLDFTSCTLMPCTADGTPLCRLDEFHTDPQAWVKLWKHHGAAAEAEELLAAARRRGEAFLRYCGETMSSEWLMPKALETLRRSPRVYEAADVFVEGADWVVWQLTGELARNACCAGYKGQYVAELGWPSADYLAEVESRLAGLFVEKLRGPVVPPGTRVGGLTAGWAELLGLAEGTPVAAPFIDAHAAVPGCGITGPGRLALVLGTSFCHMLLAEEARLFEGLCGMVRDGILPGFYGYESGQTSGGDVYGWFVDNCLPESYAAEAERRDMGLHELLTEKAQRLRPGESGLIALDWWNGNRSVLMDSELSGAIVGLTLDTRPEEIYRACIEATMFGTRSIVEAYAEAGIAIDDMVACGGLPQRNELAMQVLADVLGRPVQVAASQQTAALGSALLGATAAGAEGGGFESVAEAAAHVVRPAVRTYEPDPAAAEAYEGLYREYLLLHDYFGRSQRLMHRLRALRG